MAERFIVLPIGMVLAGGDFSSTDAAVAHAAQLVDRDRTPRVVLQVIGTTTPSKEPRADFNPEVANG